MFMSEYIPDTAATDIEVLRPQAALTFVRLLSGVDAAAATPVCRLFPEVSERYVRRTELSVRLLYDRLGEMLIGLYSAIQSRNELITIAAEQWSNFSVTPLAARHDETKLSQGGIISISGVTEKPLRVLSQTVPIPAARPEWLNRSEISIGTAGNERIVLSRAQRVRPGIDADFADTSVAVVTTPFDNLPAAPAAVNSLISRSDQTQVIAVTDVRSILPKYGYPETEYKRTVSLPGIRSDASDARQHVWGTGESREAVMLIDTVRAQVSATARAIPPR